MISELIKRNDKQYLKFLPVGYGHPISLPVITSGSRKKNHAWTWNGSLDKPTLKPSIRTDHGQYLDHNISHLWLTDGICIFLGDSTDGNAGKSLPLLNLPAPKENI